MDIRMINENCAKVTIPYSECQDIGISYNSFSPNEISSRLFLASLLTKLGSMGAHLKKCDKLTAEIFENTDGGLIMYISGKELLQEKCISKQDIHLLRTAEQVTNELLNNSCSDELTLYKISNYYALINRYDESINAAKIKEYGKLLSDSPAAMLADIL